MWERACSRMQCVSQQINWLIHRIREQARSHIFDRVWLPYPVKSAFLWELAGRRVSRAGPRMAHRGGPRSKAFVRAHRA